MIIKLIPFVAETIIPSGTYLVTTENILTAGKDILAVRIYKSFKAGKPFMKADFYCKKIINISTKPVFKTEK